MTQLRLRHLASIALLSSSTVLALGCSSDGGAATSGASADSALSRPPQFVLLAFDGSLNLGFWEESRAFAKDANVAFTYFISGVYFLANNKASTYANVNGTTGYHGPHHDVGHSDIGFGGDASSIAPRINQVILARSEGHEMQSHANGHFDGTQWTEGDWNSEFTQFNQLIFHAGSTNGVKVADLGFTPDDVVGFRAPLLGQGPGLYKALADHHFRYDTSKTSASNYWPQKLGGIWNFPLAQVRIVGSGKRTLSMDYNFYFTQSAGQPQPENKELFKKQMLDTYMQYFQDNYFGNRAPVHIGHHFSKWNGGAYWEAMQEFAKNVCGLPDVKCVTYSTLMDFMEAHAGDRDKYQQGAFPKLPRPPEASDPAPIEDAVPPEQYADEGLVGDVAEAHEDEQNP